jgi:hypothetical protein
VTNSYKGKYKAEKIDDILKTDSEARISATAIISR